MSLDEYELELVENYIKTSALQEEKDLLITQMISEPDLKKSNKLLVIEEKISPQEEYEVALVNIANKKSIIKDKMEVLSCLGSASQTEEESLKIATKLSKCVKELEDLLDEESNLIKKYDN